jgi:dienelactone hydrolase
MGCLYVPCAQAVGWLSTSGNHIINADSSIWVGRGANLHDTRSCGGGTAVDGTPINDTAAGVTEVKRRIDTLVDTWHATFIRLALESRRPQDNYLVDLNYRGRVKEIVDYIGTKPGVYVLVSIWLDPSLEPDGAPLAGAPTAATNAILAQLATDFYASPHVLYGVSNEPQNTGVDADVWTRMNDAVTAIRNAEIALGGANHHIVTVQGTNEWARDISYYVTHPIGANVAYETHVYNSPADFASLLLVGPPTRTIPVIAGEFGPINDAWHAASVADMQTLIDMANANNIPHLAWTFHQYCPPNLIADTPSQTWNANSTPADWHNMPIYPTDFGQLLINNWASAAPALLNTSFGYNTTSTNDNATRASTAQVTRLNNFGAEKRPVVVLMPGWGGVGDVVAAQDAQAILFANQGYVAVNVGFHQTGSGPASGLAAWYSDLSESVKAALEALCLQAYADCSAVVLVGESFGGTQVHPVVRYLRANGVFDGSGGANGGRKVLGPLGQDSGYTQSWSAPIDADASAYSIALIQNLGDTTFPTDICDDSGNCGTRNRADYHQTAAGSQYVLSYCPAGGEHGTRGYANWDAWVLSAVKTMLHNQRGVAKFTGYVEPSIVVSNACVTIAPTTYALTVAPTGSGTVTSSPAGINCGATCSANFNSGISVTLTATPASGNTFSSWSGACTGTGSCVVTMNDAQSVTATFTLHPTRLINLSTRGQVQTGNNVMIGGFIIGGSTPKKVLIRAVGPNLANYGVTGVLANPMLELHRSSDNSIVATNDDWGTSANAAEITATALAPVDPKEAAILATLEPGAYTAIVTGNGGGTGVGIVEVYELDHPEIPMINISTRGQVLTGNDVMIGGFIIQGSSNQTVLIRAVGPNLANYGVTGVLANPMLTLYSGQTVIATNDDWGTATNAAAITATGLAPANALESAILISLPPGAYTAVVSGSGGGTGVGIIEVYAQ